MTSGAKYAALLGAAGAIGTYTMLRRREGSMPRMGFGPSDYGTAPARAADGDGADAAVQDRPHEPARSR